MVRSCELKENGLQIPDCMIVETWAWTENYVVVVTSERPVPDCMIVRGLNLKENRTSTSWLHDCQKLDPEIKTEHQLPDRMLVRNLVLAWTEAAFHDWAFMTKLRGLLNTSWRLSFIQHAWNHCESWDVWYVKQIIGTCCPDSDTKNSKYSRGPILAAMFLLVFGSCFGSHDEAGLLAFEALQGLPRPVRGTHGSLKIAAHVWVKPWLAAPPPCTFHCFVRKWKNAHRRFTSCDGSQSKSFTWFLCAF